MGNTMIKVNHLSKAFGDLEVLRDINMEVSEGEVVCIIGPSGSGKSTFLRCINQLEKPTSGEVLYKRKISAIQRQISGSSGRKWEWCFSGLICFRSRRYSET